MTEDNSPKRLAYEVKMMLSSVASHGPAALTTTDDPMYTARLLARLRDALETERRNVTREVVDWLEAHDGVNGDTFRLYRMAREHYGLSTESTVSDGSMT